MVKPYTREDMNGKPVDKPDYNPGLYSVYGKEDDIKYGEFKLGILRTILSIPLAILGIGCLSIGFDPNVIETDMVVAFLVGGLVSVMAFATFPEFNKLKYLIPPASLKYRLLNWRLRSKVDRFERKKLIAVEQEQYRLLREKEKTKREYQRSLLGALAEQERQQLKEKLLTGGELSISKSQSGELSTLE